MSKPSVAHLSRRERQIMDIIYRAGQATAADVLAQMPDPPSYSAVRAMLRVLEDKGHLRHQQEGLAYVFLPTVAPESARRSAVSHLTHTFFDGSAERAVAAVLEASDAKLSRAELDRIAALIAAGEEGGPMMTMGNAAAVSLGLLSLLGQRRAAAVAGGADGVDL